MPTGPQGQKRPDDETSAAVQVAKIATGQEQENPESARKTVMLHLGKEQNAMPSQRDARQAFFDNLDKMREEMFLPSIEILSDMMSRYLPRDLTPVEPIPQEGEHFGSNTSVSVNEGQQTRDDLDET